MVALQKSSQEMFPIQISHVPWSFAFSPGSSRKSAFKNRPEGIRYVAECYYALCGPRIYVTSKGGELEKSVRR